MNTSNPASASRSAIRALRNYAVRRRLIGLRMLPSEALCLPRRPTGAAQRGTAVLSETEKYSFNYL